MIVNVHVTREFKLVARGSSEYTLSQEDVGLRMMFMYTPVNSEGCFATEATYA